MAMPQMNPGVLHEVMEGLAVGLRELARIAGALVGVARVDLLVKAGQPAVGPATSSREPAANSNMLAI